MWIAGIGVRVGGGADLGLSRFTRLMGKFYELLVVGTILIISE